MLILTRQSFLQNIQKAAIAGHFFWISGDVPVEKLPNFIDKMEKAYQPNKTRQAAYYDRKNGKASAKLFVYASPENERAFRYVLMLTEGEHLAHKLEKLKNLKNRAERVVYGDFHLVMKPNQKNGKPLFTWALKPDGLNRSKEDIRKTVRSRNQGAIEHLIKHLGLMPGFSGVRLQKKELQSVLNGELKRNKIALKSTKITNLYLRQVKTEKVAYIASFCEKLANSDNTVLQQLKAHRDNARKRGAGASPQIGEAVAL